MKINRIRTGAILLLAVAPQCGRAPSSANEPGICPLSCGSGQIATSEMSIQFMHEENIQISCQDLATNTNYINPIPIRFTVQRAVMPDPTSAAGTKEGAAPAGGGGGAAPPAGGAAPSSTIATSPAVGISFEASILTGFMLDRPNPGDPDAQNKYKGIATSLSEWCTDACGVGAIDVVPLCKQKENVVKVLIRSGTIAKTLTITVKPPNSEL